MRKAKLVFVFLIATVTGIFAQEISGIMMDKKSNEPLIGATISVKGTGTGTATDIDGKFQLKIIEKPPYVLLFSYIGYVNQEVEVKSEADLRRSFNVKLVTEETILKDVEIVDTRITDKQKESPLTIESMGLQAIKQTASSTFYEGLGTLKGVDMTAASLGFVIINTRGFNSTSPVRSLQLLDGADNQAPGLNFSVGNFAGATEIDIQKVDLIVGASSPLYGPNAFNGVVNLQTKNPFYHTGLTFFVKGAERNLFEGALRFAKAFKNKYGQDKFAFKINLSYLRADDWVADNMSASTRSWQPKGNPGGYDAVNRYGDELQSQAANNYDNRYANRESPGLKQFFRTGYLEKDVVNYNVRNLKANTQLFYKITEKIDARLAYNFGTGTTVYQGDNRYSLKGVAFHHLRAEIIQPDKFYIRAYTTMENTGNSYDAVFTSLKLQQYAKADGQWAQDYESFWNNGIAGITAPKARVRNLPGFPGYTSFWITKYDSVNAVANTVLERYNDSLSLWHSMARMYADTLTRGSNARVVPGTPAFDSVFNDIITRTVFEQGGTLFYDRSKMVHVQGEYKFQPKLKGREQPIFDLLSGANFRMYFPDSKGTIFSDTIARNYMRDSTGNVVNDQNGSPVVIDSAYRKIRNWEIGFYASLSRKFDFGNSNKHSFILTATCRVDKNQNFPFIATPAASVVYSYNKNHTFRVSFSSAIRNPTLQDQYLYYNVGRALLIGNLNGVDSLVTIESLYDFFNNNGTNESLLSYFSVPKVRPEKVQTVEVGYKGTILKKVYLDASAYVSFYKYFLGYQIGAEMQDIEVIPGVTNKTLKQIYRVAANSPDQVMTYGVSAGFNYYFVKGFSFNGNYTWNRLDKRGSNDPVIPAYNTPEHKFNVGISGYNIKIKNTKGLGFNVNYKWIQGFTFEGSPQFTGAIPSYSILDAQVSYEVQQIFTTFKIGASNLISKKNYLTYGGPAVGRMFFASVLVNIDQESLAKWYKKIKTKW